MCDLVVSDALRQELGTNVAQRVPEFFVSGNDVMTGESFRQRGGFLSRWGNGWRRVLADDAQSAIAQAHAVSP